MKNSLCPSEKSLDFEWIDCSFAPRAEFYSRKITGSASTQQKKIFVSNSTRVLARVFTRQSNTRQIHTRTSHTTPLLTCEMVSLTARARALTYKLYYVIHARALVRFLGFNLSFTLALYLLVTNYVVWHPEIMNINSRRETVERANATNAKLPRRFRAKISITDLSANVKRKFRHETK